MTGKLVVIDATELAELVRSAIDEALEGATERNATAALLDRAALARALDVSLATLDRLRVEGMPELRLGDVPRFELAEVLAWLRNRRQSAAAAEGQDDELAANKPDSCAALGNSGQGNSGSSRKSAKTHDRANGTGSART